MGDDKNKPSKSIFRSLCKQSTEETTVPKEPVELKPALPDLGTAPCPVCQQRVTVFVTRTKRPFINCGYCSARIFYNGRESMRRLEEVLKPIKDR
jgi:DNA-directed RNA polymerase subunit RPC12/RpoP